MSTEYIRYRIAAEHQGGFLAGYDRALVMLQQSPHCLAYDLRQCEEATE